MTLSAFIRLGVCVLLALSGTALADPVPLSQTYGFYGITTNSAESKAAGEAQLFVTVSNYYLNLNGMPANLANTFLADNQVLFTFTNTGPKASVIAQIYFEGGPLSGIHSFVHNAGIAFGIGATPPVLPGGENLSPPFNVDISASATNPAPHNGVNPGEWLGIVVNLEGTHTYEDVIAALALDSDHPLRIGLHVTSFANEESEAFVNVPPTPPGPRSVAPAPGAAVLAFVGLGLVAHVRRKLV